MLFLLTSTCNALPLDPCLTGSSFDFHISTQVLSRQKGPGRTIHDSVILTLLNFLPSTNAILFVYLCHYYSVLWWQSFLVFFSAVWNSAYMEKALIFADWMAKCLLSVFCVFGYLCVSWYLQHGSSFISACFKKIRNKKWLNLIWLKIIILKNYKYNNL